jgi:CheY-like chemotaxis protein
MHVAERVDDGRTRVLVVEDEGIVRMTMVDFLEDAGFHVIEAATGEEGLRELRGDPDIAALLTDIEMPGSVDGIHLASITHQMHPDAPVLVMSGRVRPSRAELPPGARFFAKPYVHDEVIEALHAMMSSKEA